MKFKFQRGLSLDLGKEYLETMRNFGPHPRRGGHNSAKMSD